ncbi:MULTISPECIES: fluoride efflux transporter CrcB [Nocardiopsis]|uniref:Fluoride-specific ion channel FluC n=1 Tax=Nocardiopsis dassonvillei (strain ATCC 23218 / DSM 43111 / CIP 107115 / JCM 7437 / KCTC 9190 / NBRC 14626 / NCTC 10488 / NRRL B-5397 / IMRU 509) TaxID=446468 RepID=D7B6W9_NOCDD|nr:MULTISPECIES: fluoride efflux transporter CrcB [Nocardiopsis]ADH65523.1 CrcB protein [Nocardiopsis dassonvillei subsp. dassonvillei DSM 43111]APC33887.1 CrcB protein [Nocardiopsis dassonvillei]NKY79479.1 fluoride efflux transporter CrcB [Nocardiopsis dassonvillei]VEI91541.1 camphor resistance protein CrcB [Nocardiopsis dassonvillei]
MNWDVWLVGLGGGAGAALRYLVDRAVSRAVGTGLPWGTFTVNVAGTLLLGLLVGAAGAAALPPRLWALLSVGLCGALTTYSTFSHEVLSLAREGRVPAAAGYAALTGGCALAALAAGAWAAGALL